MIEICTLAGARTSVTHRLNQVVRIEKVAHERHDGQLGLSALHFEELQQKHSKYQQFLHSFTMFYAVLAYCVQESVFVCEHTDRLALGFVLLEGLDLLVVGQDALQDLDALRRQRLEVEGVDGAHHRLVAQLDLPLRDR